MGTAHPKPRSRESRIDLARYPLARSISPTLFSNYDEVFARGVDLIIAGFAAGLPRNGKAWRDFRQSLPAG